MLRASLLLLLVAACSAAPRARPRLPTARIREGTAGNISHHPWLLSMRVLGQHVCGASVISPMWALSAAQCISTTFVNHMSVRAGSTFRESGGYLYDADDAIYNGKFSFLTADYDIGVIKITGNFSFGEHVQAVNLATSEPEEGKEVTVTGWGHQAYGGLNLTIEFYEIVTHIVDRSDCKGRYAPLKITERMICAGEEKGLKDACQGDSGGPLVADKTQYGIVSWGHGCGEPGYPGVYSNVAAFSAWLKEAFRV